MIEHNSNNSVFTVTFTKDHREYGRILDYLLLKNVVFETLLGHWNSMTENEQNDYRDKDGNVNFNKLFTTILGRDSDTAIKRHFDKLGLTTSSYRSVANTLGKQFYAMNSDKYDVDEIVGIKPQFYLDSLPDEMAFAMGHLKFGNIRWRYIDADDISELQTLIMDGYEFAWLKVEYAYNGENGDITSDITITTKLVNPDKESTKQRRESRAVRVESLAML